MASVQDVNNDGLLDLVVHISTQALQLSDTDTQAVLEGQTLDGRGIKGALSKENRAIVSFECYEEKLVRRKPNNTH